MGRRVLAMLLSMVLFVILFDNSEAILSYATFQTEAVRSNANMTEVSLPTDAGSVSEERFVDPLPEIISVSGNDVEMSSPTIDEAEDTADKSPQIPISEADEAKDIPDAEDFACVREIGDVRITINAPAGVFPAGSQATINELTDETTVNNIENAVTDFLSGDQTITSIRVFDITIYDAEGQEIQPNTEKGNVRVVIDNIDTSEAIDSDDKDMAVFHVEDSTESVTSVSATIGEGEVSFDATRFSPYAVISIDGNPDDDPAILIAPDELIESMKVKILDPSNKEIPFDADNNAKLSLNDTISVRYVFKTPITIHPVEGGYPAYDGINIRSKAKYALPGIPKVCSCPGGFDIDVTNGLESLGTIHFDEDGNAVLTVAEFHNEPAFAEDAVADLARTLNLSKESDGDQEDYSLTFGSSTYHVKIKEFMPQPPTVNKISMGLDADGNITWKITVTNDGKPIQYKDGYTFTDTIEDKQIFVENSLKSGGTPVTYTKSGNTISWTGKDNTPSKVLTYEYKTHVDFLKLTAKTNENTEKQSEVKNTVKVSAPAGDDYDALSISKTATDTVKKQIQKWIEKTGTDVDATGKSTWKIIIRNNGFKLKDVVLKDIFDTDGVEIEATNFVIKDKSNNPVSFSPPVKNGNEYTIALADPMVGNAEYTVTYDTQIKDYDKFLKGNHKVPQNKANISYKYDPTGDETTWESSEGPGVGVDFKSPNTIMPKAAIKKTAQSIDVVNHTMCWLIEINNNRQALTNVSVTDAIPARQIFKSLDWVKIEGADVSEPVYSLDDSDPTKIVVSFGDNIVGKKASFYITTELTDEANYLWAGNKKETFTNKATVKSEGNPEVTDSASKEYASTVLAKKSDNYDYNTHKIKYTITVNQNAMAMNGVVVTDKLNDNLEYVADSSSAAGTAYDIDSNTLTFTLGSISEKIDIVFEARVKDGAIFENTDKTINIPNTASMISNEYSGNTQVTCNNPINNEVIHKDGKQDKEVIEYTIKVNPARQDLYKDGIDEVLIEDIIGASMVLDKSTIKLCKADIDSTGKFTEKELVDAEIKPVEYTESKTILRVVIPKSGRNDAYILKYTARMMNYDAHDFSNIAHLKGYGDDSINLSKVEFWDTNFSTVKFSNYAFYIGELRDPNEDHILPGGHFQLLDPEQDEKVVAEATSDSNGQIMFAGNEIMPNHEYHLKQTDAPEGYVIPDDLKDGTRVVHTDDKGITVAKEKKSEHIVHNSKPDRVIDFELLDETDKLTDLTGLHDTPAKIVVYKGFDKVWETGDGEFKAVYGIEYKVVEETTPFGYHGHSEPGYRFKIDEDSEKLVLLDDYAHVIISGDTITMYDEAKDSISISIDDISKTQEKSVKGGTFEILDETDTVIKSWTGDGAPKEVELPEGEYKLKRVDEPFGFEEEDKILEFKVKPGSGGELEIEPISVTGDVIIDGKKITVPETSKDTDAITVDPAEAMGSDPLDDEIDYKLTPRKYTDGLPTGLDDTPAWKKSDGTPMDLLAQIEYDLTMTDKDGKSVSKIVMIDEHGKLVIKDYPAPKKVAPKPAPPSLVTPNPGTPGSGGSTTPATTPVTPSTTTPESTTPTVSDASSDTSVEAKSDSVKMETVAMGYSAKGKKQLAKTGGFFGTPVGYIVGLLLMAVGLLMAAGKKQYRIQ